MIQSLSSRDAYNLMLKEYPDVMNLEQMCEVLGINMKIGYKLLKNEVIISLKIGRTYRIPKPHVLTYLRIGRVNTTG